MKKYAKFTGWLMIAAFFLRLWSGVEIIVRESAGGVPSLPTICALWIGAMFVAVLIGACIHSAWENAD